MLSKFLYHGGAIVSAFSLGCVLISIGRPWTLFVFLVCFLGGLLAHTIGISLLNKEKKHANSL